MGKAQYQLGYPDEIVLKNLLEGTKKDSARGHHDIEALLTIAHIYTKMEWGLALAYDIEGYDLTVELYENGKRSREIADFLCGIAYEIAAIYASMGYLDDSAKWLEVAFKSESKNYREIAREEKIFQPVLQQIEHKIEKIKNCVTCTNSADGITSD